MLRLKIKQRLAAVVLKFWYSKSVLAYFLLPLAWLFQIVTFLRYHYYHTFKQHTRFPIPIIVIGNISLGGTGKTPLVGWLANYLFQQGFQPGIVMRGYGSALQHHEVALVPAQGNAQQFGDEAVVLAEQCPGPVVIGAQRVATVKHLIENFPHVNVIISDDGLQHYAMARAMEIIVLDERGVGNGFCLPAGPLRESPTRLKRADFVVSRAAQNNTMIQLSTQLAAYIQQVAPSYCQRPLVELAGQTVHAVAAIGYPEQFFKMLRQQGIHIIAHPFADHHIFTEQDFNLMTDHPILMTHKDAVKCRQFNLKDAWAVPLEITVPDAFAHQLVEKLYHGQKTIRHTGLSDLQTTTALSKKPERIDL